MHLVGIYITSITKMHGTMNIKILIFFVVRISYPTNALMFCDEFFHSRDTYNETYCFGCSPERNWDRFWPALMIFHSYVYLYLQSQCNNKRKKPQNIIRVIKPRKMGQVPRMGQKRNAYRVLA